MKAYILYLFLLLPVFAEAQNLEDLRKEYARVPDDSAVCAKLYKMVSVPSNDNIIKGYKGAITTAMAGHVTNKMEKLRFFKSGKNELEQSLAADNSNVELRYLRYTVQMHAPGALGYNKELDSDRKYIIDNLGAVKNQTAKAEIKKYLLLSGKLNEAEKQKVGAAN